MFLVDTVQGRIIDDEEIKAEIVGRKPYRCWVTQYGISLDELPEPLNVPQPNHPTIRQRQQAFGYTVEELKMVITPMVVTGEEAISSMGNRYAAGGVVRAAATPLQVFQTTLRAGDESSDRPDPRTTGHVVGHQHRPQTQSDGRDPESCRRIKVQQPILTNADLQKIREITDSHFKSKTLRMLFRVAEGPRRAGRRGR